MPVEVLTSLSNSGVADRNAFQSARLHGDTVAVAPDVAVLPLSMVNVVFLGKAGAGDREWVLVDTGIYGSASWIKSAAADRFQKDSRPSGIVLTHGHFDHVGAAAELANEWDCPIWIHPTEMPFVTGKAPYPQPDPLAGRGAMSWLSWMYPRGPFALPNVRPLPDDGSVPGAPQWRWIATPGHSPGHVSLFRESDRTLVAGDAFVTQDQESLWGVLSMEADVYRPPAYYTPDWDAAWLSVRTLRDLAPNVAITGHGVAVYGDRLARGLDRLVNQWQTLGRPAAGRYSFQPASIQGRDAFSAQCPVSTRTRWALGLGVVAGLVVMAAVSGHSSKRG